MSASPCRLGIVGTGAIVQTYAQVLASSDLIKVVGVADVRLETAKAMGEVLGCPAFESHTALVRGTEMEAALVATPPASHAAICVDLLDQGIHVMCEKPFTTGLESAREVLSAAAKSGAVITMASKFRYVDDLIRARGIITSGILGDILSFENAFTARVDMSARWNSDPELGGGGVLIDNGTHSLDILRYLLGPVREVQVIEGKRAPSLGVEDTVHVFAKTESGVPAHIDLSWSINKELESYVSVYGTSGSVSVGWRSSRFRQSTSRDWVVFGKGYDKFQALRGQIENFVRSLRKEEVLLITAQDALASVEVMEAAYEALRQSRWVCVHDTTRAGAVA